MAVVDEDATSERILTFDLGERAYCIDADRVASVLGVDAAGSGVADAADPWNAGEIGLEGRRIRVVDLLRIVAAPTGAGDRPEEGDLIVFDATHEDGALIGWLVDDVGRMTVADADALEPARTTARFVRGNLERDGDESLVWLDEAALNE